MSKDRDHRSIWTLISETSVRVWARVSRASGVFRPGERARRAGSWSAVALAVFISFFFGATRLRTGYGAVADGVLGTLYGLAYAIGVGLITWMLLVALSRLPRPMVPILVAALAAILTVSPAGNPFLLLLFAALLALTAVIAAGLAGLTEFRRVPPRRKVGLVCMIGISLGALAAVTAWFLHPGSTDSLVKVETRGLAQVVPLDLPDPSERGPYRVARLTYGSGNDLRLEFGSAVDIRTARVDGTRFLDEPRGFRAWWRHEYWGFEADALPVQGRVWYPEGPGPFPLVLVVHGNHMMRDHSDLGYAYLAELLASRGYVAVSVDQNFLNGDWSRSYRRETVARAWLLLEHLALWRDWVSDPNSPFFGLADMERIVLVGHSRGGEAVATAAAFNNLAHYPDDATVDFNFHFGIRGVVALAPTDGQVRPTGRPTPVRGVSYLLLHGSHDSDISVFAGDRVFTRLDLRSRPGTFKASVYIYRANHAQFNESWSGRDGGPLSGQLLNNRATLPGEDQRQVASVYVSAFMDVITGKDEQYLPLFRDHRRGLQWLPETHYVSRFADGTESIVAEFDEDVDVTTGTMTGTVLYGSGLANWREDDLDRGGGRSRENQVAFLGWRAGRDLSLGGGSDEEQRTPRYLVRLPRPAAVRSIVFSAAQIDERPRAGERGSTSGSAEPPHVPAESAGASPGRAPPTDPEPSGTPLDFSVAVVDATGQVAALPLSSVWDLLPPLEVRFTRLPLFLERIMGGGTEPVLQTIEIPSERFLEANPEFDAGAVVEIRFLFDRSPSGVIALDEIGYRAVRSRP